MTTKEHLTLMDDIKRKNDIAWSKYANQPRRYWTWEADVKKSFHPFDGVAGFCVLMVCFPVLLVLFLMMA